MMLSGSQAFRDVIKSGAVYGLLFGALAESLLRLIYLLERRIQESVPIPPDTHIQMASYPFPWWYIPLLSFTLLLPASVLAHRFIRPYTKSQFWLWQVAGFTGVSAFYLATLINDLFNAHFSVMGADYWRVAWSMKATLWLSLILAVSIYSFVYGWLAKYLMSGQGAADL